MYSRHKKICFWVQYQQVNKNHLKFLNQSFNFLWINLSLLKALFLAVCASSVPVSVHEIQTAINVLSWYPSSWSYQSALKKNPNLSKSDFEKLCFYRNCQWSVWLSVLLIFLSLLLNNLY